jgi:rubrerythrin
MRVRTSESVYRRFIEFEERAGEIYLQLASHFSQERQLSAFWLEMAMHEKQHAGLLQFCLLEGLFASDLPDSSEIQKLTDFFKRLEKRAADPKLTVDQAFVLAIELEASEVNGICGHLTSTLHRSMYLVRRKIATSLPEHIDELVVQARKFGVGNTAMKELNRLREHCSAQWQPHE